MAGDDLLDEHEAAPATTLRRMWRMMGSGLQARRALVDDPGPALEAWVASLGRLKGIAMKMGQIMSYIDVALPPEAMRALAALQTRSATMDTEQVQSILREELGAQAPRLDVAPRACASASIGQVHQGRLDGHVVAVKVRFPEIEDAIRSDFRLAGIAPAMARLFVPTSQVRPLLREAQRQFLIECDYRHEAEAQRRLRELHASDPDLVIPAVHDISTRLVLVSDWIDGLELEAFLASEPSRAERDRVGRAIHRFYVGSLLRFGIYNGDPHPGNQLYLDDGRVAILDHGCTRDFEKATVLRLARLMLAARDDDDAKLDGVLQEMDIAHGPRLHDARRFVRAFHAPFTSGPIDLGASKDMASILQDKRRLLRLRLPGEFLFLLRIRFGLASLLTRLDAHAEWADIEAAWASMALAEDRAST